MVCLKRKKRAQKLAYLTCSYNPRNQDNTGSRPIRNRRQPDYLKDYHLGTLPLETPIRNTNLPPAHSNVCTLWLILCGFSEEYEAHSDLPFAESDREKDSEGCPSGGAGRRPNHERRWRERQRSQHRHVGNHQVLGQPFFFQPFCGNERREKILEFSKKNP